jgi:hypothetical protein
MMSRVRYLSGGVIVGSIDVVVPMLQERSLKCELHRTP